MSKISSACNAVALRAGKKLSKLTKAVKKEALRQAQGLRKSQAAKGLLGVLVIGSFVLVSVISGQAMIAELNNSVDCGYGYGYGYYCEIIQVPGDYSTIQAAIDAAEPEETTRIMVAPGVYQENLVLRENIGLYAKGPRVIINGNGAGTVISNVCNNVIDGFKVANPGNSGSGIEVSSSCERDKSVIQNNIIDGYNRGIYGIKTGEKTTVNNNTIVNFQGLGAAGIAITAGRPRVHNNIAASNVYNIVCLEPTRALVEYNDLWDASFSDWGGSCGESQYPDNFTDNPEFVDGADGDYHLQSSSPLIDAGFEYVPTLSGYDYDQNERIIDGDFDSEAKIDIGADEYWPEYTTVEGAITKNTIWTLSNSPYKVIGNILVEEGVTLAVMPGVRVEFDGYYYMKVEGELKVLGTTENKVVFTSDREAPMPGDWESIKFVDSSVDAVFDEEGNYLSGSVIANAEMSYGQSPIYVDKSSPYIVANYLHHNNISAIYLIYSGSVVKYNQISDNSGRGIYASYYDQYTYPYKSPQILDNHIANNTDSGVYIEGVRDTKIENNYIVNNRASYGAGIRVYHVITTVEILNNKIISNEASGKGGGIYVFTDFSSDHTTTLIKYNIIKDNICDNISPDFGGSAINITNYYSDLKSVIENNNIVNNIGSRAIVVVDDSNIDMHQNNIINEMAQYEVYLSSSTKDINAEENYWGTVRWEDILERTYDYRDDFELGKVKFIPYEIVPVEW